MYFDIYNRRLNKYGNSLQERLQSLREKEFANYLKKSVYTIEFEYGGARYLASFEPYNYKQNQSKLVAYLLTDVHLNIPNGTILDLPDKDGILGKWMIFYYEFMKASGYNRYIILKMNHEINWVGRDQQNHTIFAYLYGPMNAEIDTMIKSRAGTVLYEEHNTNSYLIHPIDSNFNYEDYFEIIIGERTEAYTVTGIDIISIEGVQFTCIDPTYVRDKTVPPQPTPSDNPEDFYWLTNGGDVNGN